MRVPRVLSARVVTVHEQSVEVEAETAAGLAEEQAALRRVATLVAAGAPPAEIFARATEEIGRLFRADSAGMVRYDVEANTAEMVGRWESAPHLVFDVGTVVSLDDDTTIARVFRSGGPMRLEWEGVEGALAEGMRAAGFTMTVAAPIEVDGRLWGAVSVGWSRQAAALPQGTEQRLGAFAELVALGLSSADAHERLLRSRARIVEAADAARLQIARNLHDGAQQRLVALGMHMRVALRLLESGDPQAAERLREACSELDATNAELRELARGIHPVVLTEQGLASAVHGLARRSGLPVQVVEVPERRLPTTVEVAAYYVVAEALTNVAKYAEASHVTVRVSHDDDTLAVEVADDGRGGADPANGSGLRGLQDRLSAIDGTLALDSPPERGTRLRASVPLRA
jgi:signal transduction histidine kinase